MKTETKSIAPEVLLEEYRRLLEEDGQAENLPLLISGGSMSPFLVGGRDTVFLSRVEKPLRRGDMVLYRRSGGAYVLHRILKADTDAFTMLGDAQTVPEPGIRPDQVIAVVARVQRKGKLMGPGSFWWEFFARIWLRLRPLRRPLMGLYNRIYALRTGVIW